MTKTEQKIKDAKVMIKTRYNETKRPFDPPLHVDHIETLTVILDEFRIRMIFKTTVKGKQLYEVIYNERLHEFYLNTYKKVEQFDFKEAIK